MDPHYEPEPTSCIGEGKANLRIGHAIPTRRDHHSRRPRVNVGIVGKPRQRRAETCRGRLEEPSGSHPPIEIKRPMGRGHPSGIHPAVLSREVPRLQPLLHRPRSLSSLFLYPCESRGDSARYRGSSDIRQVVSRPSSALEVPSTFGGPEIRELIRIESFGPEFTAATL